MGPDYWNRRCFVLKAEVERYKAALREIAKKDSVHLVEVTEIARRALEKPASKPEPSPIPALPPLPPLLQGNKV